MVQVQSTWFPLYDRNPQTFVPNIFTAKPPTSGPRRTASGTPPAIPHTSRWVCFPVRTDGQYPPVFDLSVFPGLEREVAARHDRLHLGGRLVHVDRIVA